MREILFRGKQKDADVWLVGDLRQWSEHKKGICDRALKTTLEVDPETIGQFTGLYDNDGKKIFEGDILSDDYNESYSKIEFNDGGFQIIEENICWNCQDCNMKDFEIIGNIHDNPEILKEVTENEN